MRPGDVVGDPVSRRVSPLFFVLALVCFFFTFAGVSCDTAKAKQAVSSLSDLGGSGSTNVGQLNQCLDALNGTNLVSYSGFTLAFGGAPAQLATIPSGCQSGGLSPSTSTGSAASQANIGLQPLALIGLIAVAGGIVAGIVFMVIRVGPRLRNTLAAMLGFAGFLVLLFDQLHVHSAISTALNSAATGSGAPFSVSDFFDINDGLAWILCLVALGAATLYHGAALLALPAVATHVPSGEEHPPP